MSSDQTREIEDSKARNQAAHAETLPQYDNAPSIAEESGIYSASLVIDPALRGRANNPIRAAAMQQMQKTHGNRAVQRFVQRTLSVQREDDEEDFVPRFTPFPPSLDMSLGSVDASVTPGGPGLSYEGGPLHAGADFGWDGQVDLNLGYGKPLLPWRMDIDPSMAAGAEGVNSLMNNPWPPSSGTANKLFGMAGSLGDIAGAGEPSPYNLGVGVEGKLSSEEQRIMLGVGTSF